MSGAFFFGSVSFGQTKEMNAQRQHSNFQVKYSPKIFNLKQWIQK